MKNIDQFQSTLLLSVSVRSLVHSKGYKPSSLSRVREKAVAALCPLNCLYMLKHLLMIFVCLVMKYPIFSSVAEKGEAFLVLLLFQLCGQTRDLRFQERQ